MELPRKSVYEMKDVDWKEWAERLDELCRNNEEELREAQKTPAELAQKLERLIFENCDNIFLKKTVCKYSKPYWTKELSHLATKVNIAAKIFQKRSSHFNRTSWEGPSRMGLVRILELGHFMLHLVVTHFKHFIKSNYFCSPSTI